MNWNAINFDWNQARSFLATAEEGSFSAAARVLGQTQPTVGRQVAALEQALGVILFERVGKSLNLTIPDPFRIGFCRQCRKAFREQRHEKGAVRRIRTRLY